MQTLYLWDGLHDMFWASVLGQFGLIGTSIYGFFLAKLVLMVSAVHFMQVKGKRLFWGGLLACAYMLIASLGESSFSSFYAVPFGAFIGYIYDIRKKIDIDRAAGRLRQSKAEK